VKHFVPHLNCEDLAYKWKVTIPSIPNQNISTNIGRDVADW